MRERDNFSRHRAPRVLRLSSVTNATNVTRATWLLPAMIIVGADLSACKPRIATPDECEKAAVHLADLQIKKEKTPPLGRLLPPFDDPDHEQSLRDEAHDNAKAHCLKGWKRDVYECVMQATDVSAFETCRKL